ncbi:hypothetical protein ABFS83_01G064500 [Erythranthe nasuta]
MASNLITSATVLSFFLLLLLMGISAATPTGAPTSYRHHHNRRHRSPCKTLAFYFHDILYNGHNSKNATAAIVAAPAWAANTTTLSNRDHFGNVVVFDDPITLDNDLRSTPVGRAQGFYLYDRKDVFTAWLGFSFVFNSTEHKGSINFAGADPLMNKTRDISVIGGTGDFFMTRGVATLTTDALEGDVYFRLHADIRLYECW